MKKLGILIFNWRCWLNPESGGAEIFIRENTVRWAKAGHDITLFTSEFSGQRKNEEIFNGVRIVRTGGKYSVYSKAREYYKDRFVNENYDIIIDAINTRPFLTPKFVNKGKVVAIIFQLAREYWFYETPFPVSYIGYYLLENRWLKNYVNIPTITISESSKRDLIDLGFTNVFIVPVGVNFKPLNEIPEKEKYPVVAYVGRLKRAKRPDHAIRAFKIVKDKIPEAELWIIGDGNYRKDLVKIATNGVRFFGSLPNEERRKLLKKAWVLVNPSVREGFGLNVIEANALGTPCVAYDVAGLRDSVKDNETGMLAQEGSIEDLADKITKFFSDGNLAQRLSRNALINSRKFSWDECAEAFMNVVTHSIESVENG